MNDLRYLDFEVGLSCAHQINPIERGKKTTMNSNSPFFLLSHCAFSQRGYNESEIKELISIFSQGRKGFPKSKVFEQLFQVERSVAKRFKEEMGDRSSRIIYLDESQKDILDLLRAAYFHLCTDDPIYKITYSDVDNPKDPYLIVKDVSDPRTIEYLKDTRGYIQDILIDFNPDRLTMYADSFSDRSQRLKRMIKICCSKKLKGKSDEEKTISFFRFSYDPFKDIIGKLREIFHLLYEAGRSIDNKAGNISRAREIFDDILSTYDIRKILPEELNFDVERAFLAIQDDEANREKNPIPDINAVANNNFPDIDFNAIPSVLGINQYSFYKALNRLKKEQYLNIFQSMREVIEKERGLKKLRQQKARL